MFESKEKHAPPPRSGISVLQTRDYLQCHGQTQFSVLAAGFWCCLNSMETASPSVIQPRPGSLQWSRSGHVQATKIFQLSEQVTTCLALVRCRTRPQKHLGNGCRSASASAIQKTVWSIKFTVLLCLGLGRGREVRW